MKEDSHLYVDLKKEIEENFDISFRTRALEFLSSLFEEEIFEIKRLNPSSFVYDISDTVMIGKSDFDMVILTEKYNHIYYVHNFRTFSEMFYDLF